MDNCFASIEIEGKELCSALNKKNCEGCAFWKRKRTQEIDEKLAMDRLKKLEKVDRLNISEKYGVEGIVDEKN